MGGFPQKTSKFSDRTQFYVSRRTSLPGRIQSSILDWILLNRSMLSEMVGNYIQASSGGLPGDILPPPTLVASARRRPPELPLLAEVLKNEIP